MIGRPTKLTAAVQERIVGALRAGNYIEPACQAAGVSASTHFRWMARGERERKGIYWEYAQAVRRAQAEAEVEAVGLLREAWSDDWRAIVAFLERRSPARWRQQSRTELTGADGGPIQLQQHSLDVSRLSDDDLRFLQELYERAAEPDSD